MKIIIVFFSIFFTFYCNADQPEPGQSLNSWFDQKIETLRGTGGTISIDPGLYSYNAPLTVPSDFKWKLLITGYGAELRPQGAISGIVLKQWGRESGVKIQGIKINQANQPNAIAGIQLVGAWHTKINDVTIAYNNAFENDYKNWCGIVLKQDEELEHKHSLWTTITESKIRAISNPAFISCAIDLSQYSSETTIQNNSIFNTVTAIKIRALENENYPNVVRIINNAFENGPASEGGTVLWLDHKTNFARLSGIEFSGNRIEGFTTGIKISGPTPFVSVMKGFVVKYNRWGWNINEIDNPQRNAIIR